jgi:hypothetical protein
VCDGIATSKFGWMLDSIEMNEYESIININLIIIGMRCGVVL